MSAGQATPHAQIGVELSRLRVKLCGLQSLAENRNRLFTSKTNSMLCMYCMYSLLQCFVNVFLGASSSKLLHAQAVGPMGMRLWNSAINLGRSFN